MKIRMYRSHKVRPMDYESIDLAASVEIDTEVDADFAEMTDKEISDELDQTLDTLLDKPVNRALRLGGTMEESHIWDFYEKD